MWNVGWGELGWGREWGGDMRLNLLPDFVVAVLF